MLSVRNKRLMLSVIMLNVIMPSVFTLSVVAPDTAITLKVYLSTNVSQQNGFLPKSAEPFCLFPLFISLNDSIRSDVCPGNTN